LTHQWPFEHAYASLIPPYAPAPDNVRRLAEQVLHKAVGLDKAHEMLGREYLRANDLDRALLEFRSLAKIYPVDPVGQQATADILMKLNRPAEAIPYYRATVGLLPRAPEPALRLALALHATGDDDGAVAQCRHVLAYDPGNAAALKAAQEIRAHPAVPGGNPKPVPAGRLED
jgi:predicted Zn-dependent protease